MADVRRGTAAPGGRGPDLAIAVALLVGAAVYVARLPRVLGGSDEGIFLYEAKRLLEGQVFYRDVFDLITPGSHYLMAALFWLFGTDIATARIADAVVHGLIVAVTYAICRTLGVRRTLAAAAALLDVAVFEPAWTVASPHWFATLLGLVLLFVLVRRPRYEALVAGVVTGALVAVQQQKGAVLGTGAALVLASDALLVGGGGGSLVRRLGAFAGGVLLVVVPLMGALVAMAGAAPVFQALVLHPLVNYRGRAAGAPWGYLGPFAWYARYTFPRVLPWEPVLTALMAMRVAVALVRGDDPERLRRSLVLTVMSLAAVGSIAYFADYIHLAFIGPVFAVLAADLLEAALGGLARRAPVGARVAGGLTAVLVLAGVAFQLRTVMAGSWQDYPIAYRSPFGTLHFHHRKEIDMLERVRAVLDAAGAKELFIYPAGAGFYLLTGTTNPTAYQFLVPGYSRPDQLEDAAATLARRRVPFVLVFFPLGRGEPVADEVLAHYEAVLHGSDGQPLLWRRLPEEVH